MSQQLVKKGANGGMVNVNPKSWIEAIKDKNTGQTLVEILQGFNMYFLPYNGNTSATRCLVPTMLRKKGLWITYVKYDGNVYTEWYAADELDDKSWGDSSNWRIGNNILVGDITISANGNWVINGTETEFKAVGEKGNTPLLRVANNRLQVSYDLGDTYIDVTNNPVYTKFRWLATTGDTQANNVGRIQASTDEGKTWTNMSNDFTNNLHIKKYIGVNESLPTSGIAEGTIYAKGPYYAEDDTLNDNPIYRLWVYAWKGNTLAWQDNGEFQSIAAGIVQETGDSENATMSQKAITRELAELGSEVKNSIPQIYINSINAQLEGNLFNKNAVGIIKDFVFYDTPNDAYKELEGYNISEYIAVEPNSVYSIDKRINIKGYDKQLNFASSLTANDTKLEIPENVYWIRFSYYAGWEDAIYVNKGEVSSPNRKYGIISAEKLKEKSINKEKLDDELANEFEKIDNINTEIIRSKDKFTLYNNLLHIQGEGNIFNKDAAGILKNKIFYDNNGNITDREQYNVSDYMAVKPNSTYRISVGITVQCYDINFVHLGIVSAPEKVFTTLENTYWLRFSYYAGWTITFYEDSANVKSSKYGLTRTNNIEDSAITLEKLSDEVKSKIEQSTQSNTKKTGSFTVRGNLSDGQSFYLPKNSVSVKTYCTFSANIVGTFGSLLIGHGENEYTAAFIKIESNKVIAHSKLSETHTTKEFSHGLTIENNIQVLIDKEKSTDLTITISSNGKSYSFNWDSWYGNNGQPFVRVENGNLINCSFGWTSKGITSDIWAFGDSYFGVNGTIRWMAYLISAGHTNLIVNAFGGQGSLSAYEDLTNLFTIGTPKKILWCLGMNDADSSTAVNSNWLNTYNSVKNLCESNNIELILATIPTVPTRINKYKNEIVRNSGYRYIDFDKAVGANEATGEWFGNMLYSDGVHPSETGALALYHQAIADMPELLNC